MIEDVTQFTVEKFVESSDSMTLEDRFMVLGVDFIEVMINDETVFYHVDDDGFVTIVPLLDPRETINPPKYSEERYTFAELKDDGSKVLVDDDGLHNNW